MSTEPIKGQNQSEKVNERITIDALAKLTGFPVEMVKNELLINDKALNANSELSLEDLRELVLNYVDRSFAD